MTTSELANEQAAAQRRYLSPFARHFLEMVAAMIVGMMVLGGLFNGGLALAGVDDSGIPAELDAMAMAFAMSAGMTVWMRYRSHGWRSILEMDGAMFASFFALFPLYWLDVISGDAMLGLGHVLMIPVMLALMRHRRHEHEHA